MRLERKPIRFSPRYCFSHVSYRCAKFQNEGLSRDLEGCVYSLEGVTLECPLCGSTNTLPQEQIVIPGYKQRECLDCGYVACDMIGKWRYGDGV